MRNLRVSLVVAALLMTIHPAAAQTFDDRWSIIPKAHADPAPPQSEDVTPSPSPAEHKSAVPGLEEHNAADTETHKAAEPPKRVFSGKASFYSYRKAKTASGSDFDRDQLTAAHRTLPLGTRLRVTDLATNKSVVVRITDRGPFIRSRVLDLSLAAARQLGITERGIIRFRAEVL